MQRSRPIGAGPGAVAAIALALAPAAVAQDARLEEVVVTATRQASTRDRVALSLAALTQRGLDEQGVRQIGDLVGLAPALRLSQTTPGVANLALRGIQNPASTNTAPTTGFYLDDTPLHKRNTAGFLNGNGTPLPPLFDLERVEVLRGPQGVLYGGSAQGGAIRYITPAPSLTRYTAYARAEASLMKHGDARYEAGLAVGGPLVHDQLGFRTAVYAGEGGGFIDYIDPFTGRETHRNANGGDARMARVALLWAPSERSRATLSYLTSTQRSDSNVSLYTLPIAAPIVEAPVCFNNSAASPLRPDPFPTPVACNGPGVSFVRPGGTFGPYPDLGSDDLLTPLGLAPTKTVLQVSSLALDYDLGLVTVRSITSYVRDHNFSYSNPLGNELALRFGDFIQAGAPASMAFPSGGRFNRGLPIAHATREFGEPDSPFGGYAEVNNRRHGLAQELRLASAGDARPLSWVAGLYYANMRVKTFWRGTADVERLSQALYGLTAAQRYGVGGGLDEETGLPIAYDFQRYSLKDVEVAGFGEAGLRVTPRLKLSAGLRLSRLSSDYSGRISGAAAGQNAPSLVNGGFREGSTSENPVTPKLGAEYDLEEGRLVYASASKGYRSGGVNPALSPALCNPVLARYGLSVDDTPVSYAGDSVWSYEVGAKLRLLDGRVQVNGDLFRIDWSHIQTPLNFPGCSTPVVANAGSARSQGGELEAQARVVRGLTAELAIGYLDAEYRETITAPAAAGFHASAVAFDGQAFPTPDWTIHVGARYELEFAGRARGYVRGDWRWTSSYAATPPFGAPGYSPDQHKAPATSRLDFRAGVELGAVDLALFVNNVFNSNSGPVSGGRTGCTPAGGRDCTTYAQYNPALTAAIGLPRQIGLQIAYRR